MVVAGIEELGKGCLARLLYGPFLGLLCLLAPALFFLAPALFFLAPALFLLAPALFLLAPALFLQI
jgi:hypothetical protein